jgi:hypothetical protein
MVRRRQIGRTQVPNFKSESLKNFILSHKDLFSARGAWQICILLPHPAKNKSSWDRLCLPHPAPPHKSAEARDECSPHKY